MSRLTFSVHFVASGDRKERGDLKNLGVVRELLRWLLQKDHAGFSAKICRQISVPSG